MPPKEQPLTMWTIYLARSTPAKWLGTVEASDVDEAIAEAARQFNVKEPKKLVAVRRPSLA